MISDTRDPEYMGSAHDFTNRMNNLKKSLDKFWKRWKKENFQEHYHMYQEKLLLSMMKDTYPRGLWRLGRIDELLPSTDGKLCDVSVKGDF